MQEGERSIESVSWGQQRCHFRHHGQYMTLCGVWVPRSLPFGGWIEGERNPDWCARCMAAAEVFVKSEGA